LKKSQKDPSIQKLKYGYFALGAWHLSWQK
jgi:hypothetical protein